MPKINHGRNKPKYSPVPNAQERRHMSRVMERGCLVCGGQAIAHHILQHSQHKRWRRDHQQVVPLCDRHHAELHGNGNEIAWQEGHGLDLAEEAQMLLLESVMEGIL
jgi:hypothetical protein